MLDVFSFSEQQILLFALVLVRMSSFVVAWPVFGMQMVPGVAKVLFAVTLTILLYPIVKAGATTVSLDSLEILLLFAREATIGFLSGYLARCFFYIFQILGELTSLSMGLSNSSLFNPAFGGQVTALEQFYVLIATLFFLTINGHHILLSGLVDSFRILPIGVSALSFEALGRSGDILQTVVMMGLKLSGPILISILVMNLAMALVGRAIPQINVLITSLPVNILVGFFVIAACLPLLIWQMGDFLELTTNQVFRLIRSM